jgi:hypothetical protein
LIRWSANLQGIEAQDDHLQPYTMLPMIGVNLIEQITPPRALPMPSSKR